jgi:hypothetical protein
VISVTLDGGGQAQGEAGTAEVGVAHLERAFVLPGDLVRDGQAQPGALVGRLRREEGVEDLLARCGLDARAVERAKVTPDRRMTASAISLVSARRRCSLRPNPAVAAYL